MKTPRFKVGTKTSQFNAETQKRSGAKTLQRNGTRMHTDLHGFFLKLGLLLSSATHFVGFLIGCLLSSVWISERIHTDILPSRLSGWSFPSVPRSINMALQAGWHAATKLYLLPESELNPINNP